MNTIPFKKPRQTNNRAIKTTVFKENEDGTFTPISSSTIHEYVDGEDTSEMQSTEINSEIENLEIPTFSVYGLSGAVFSTTESKMMWTTVRTSFDEKGYFDLSSSVFNPKVGGTYLIGVNVEINNSQQQPLLTWKGTPVVSNIVPDAFTIPLTGDYDNEVGGEYRFESISTVVVRIKKNDTVVVSEGLINNGASITLIGSVELDGVNDFVGSYAQSKKSISVSTDTDRVYMWGVRIL